MKITNVKLNFKSFRYLGAVLSIAAAIVIGVYANTYSDKTHAQASLISTVYTWGRGANGAPISTSPTAVSGLPSDITDIQAANWGGLAIDSTGTAWQWNANSTPTASAVVGPTNVVSVGEGFDFGAAVTSSGSLWTWGDEHGQGDLCLGTVNKNNVSPTQVRGVSNATEVSGGGDHLMFLENNGHVETCGSNAYGELGDGKNTNSNVPVEVSLPGPVKEIFGGGSGQRNGQAIVLLDNGSVYAWGSDAWGQLGNDKTESYSNVPVPVDLPTGVTFTAVATGAQTSYGLDSQGNVWAWGDDSQGQIGNGNNYGYILTPVEVASGYSQISSVANVVVGG